MLGGLLADLFGFNISCSAGAALILAITVFQAAILPAPPAGDRHGARRTLTHLDLSLASARRLCYTHPLSAT